MIMAERFTLFDAVIFFLYGLLVISVGFYVARKKKGEQRSVEDYFLAGKSLPWWAVGASLIAANISAEQFIGMTGSGYEIGLAMASYEWMGGLTLVVVGKFLLPVFFKNKIFTMPQFLEMRFDKRVKTSLAVFWLLLYVFINLTSVLYLGALFMHTVLGIELIHGIIILAAFTAIYSIYGGLMSVAWTDVIHVLFLIGGGIITTVLALSHIGEGEGIINNLDALYAQAPEKFNMILERSHNYYHLLPGIAVLVGGMWIGNISYFGFSQYVTQKAFAAKSLTEAQRGTVFAGYLKILMPFIVVIPGIIAYVLNPGISPPDKAYPWLLSTFVPAGFKGAAIAALFAAIVSSLSSMANSTSTIFTMDIYTQFHSKKLSDNHLVKVGRFTTAAALLTATLLAKPFLGNLDQAFQFIQEYSSWVNPAIVLIFGVGFFWKRATSNAVLWATIAALPLSALLKIGLPAMAFMNREVIVFFVLLAIVVAISYFEKNVERKNLVQMGKGMFHTGLAFNAGAIGICMILTVLYIVFW
jgi:solute:Na+ symporter, SSS family